MMSLEKKLRYLAFRRSFDLKPKKINKKEIDASNYILVSCLRNEDFRLNYFLDYYRTIGVEHFIFIDNGSTDDTLKILNENSDVSLWVTYKSYKTSRYGMDWCNFLINKYCRNKWVICCDPDEFLIYPQIETRSISSLTKQMELNNQFAMNTILIDCYSKFSSLETKLDFNQSPFEVCEYFDKPNMLVDFNENKNNLWIRGGVRLRKSQNVSKAPAINKICLIHNKDSKFLYNSSMHDLVPIDFNVNYEEHHVSGVMMHFKFISSLKNKIEEELERKQHYDNSSEYKNYQKNLKEVFYNKNVSIRYENSSQLEEIGLIQEGKKIL